MPIDPAGTAPGVEATEPSRPIVNMLCKRPGCGCHDAVDMAPPNGRGFHMYVCVKCKANTTVQVGGAFEF